MMDRLLEYVALLRGDLRRNGWMGGRIVAHMPLVVYNGRTKWNVPLRLDDSEWVPEELRDLQPRLAGRLVDAKDWKRRCSAPWQCSRPWTISYCGSRSGPGATVR